MDYRRLWRTFRLNLFLNGAKRLDYIRKRHIFAHFGENSTFAPKVIPLYPELIYIGNNVRIAARVSFIPHDMIHAMLNNRPGKNWGGRAYREYVGCIKINDNVFVGSHSTILADVNIGSNVIIGAGTLVNKDLPGGYVYAGVPAKAICTFEEFLQKRRGEVNYPEEFSRTGSSIGSAFAEWMWADFERRRRD